MPDYRLPANPDMGFTDPKLYKNDDMVARVSRDAATRGAPKKRKLTPKDRALADMPPALAAKILAQQNWTPEGELRELAIYGHGVPGDNVVPMAQLAEEGINLQIPTVMDGAPAQGLDMNRASDRLKQWLASRPPPNVEYGRGYKPATGGR
jgi:hypothetical protein